MLYSKPANKSYTDMSIEFDNEFYTDTRDDSKLYKYMYLIFYMLACKKNYFHKFEDYDYFARFATSTIYMRYIKKQREGYKYRSILNYAKSTLSPLKVMYQNNSFADIKNPSLNNTIESFELQQQLKNSIQSDYMVGLEDEINKVLETLPKIIKQTIDETPYSSDKLMYKNIYLSCILSLINSLTLNNITKKKYESKLESNTLSNDFFYRIVEKERLNCSMNWKLDSNMEDYIKVLTNKIRARLNDEILDTRNSFMLSEDVLDDILISATLENNKSQEVWDDEK